MCISLLSRSYRGRALVKQDVPEWRVIFKKCDVMYKLFSDKRERTPSGSTIIMSLLAQVIPILHKNSWHYCLFFQVQFVGGVIVRRSVKFYYWFFVLVVMFNCVLIFSLIQQPDVLFLSLVTWTCSFVTSLAHIETQYQISIKLIDVKMIFYRWSCALQLQYFTSSPSRVSFLLVD